MVRRDFLSTAAALSASRLAPLDPEAAPIGPSNWRGAFPQLQERINGRPLIYLDTAATALRPKAVVDAIANFDRHDNANPGAALHTLARRAAAALDGARAATAAFIGVRDPLEVVFTRGTTEGLNLLAAAWGDEHLRPGDEILVSIAEHASNLLPWRYLAKRTGARLVTFDIDDDGHLRLDDLETKLTPKTRVVAVSHVSNVLGIINPVREVSDRARAPGRLVVVDAAQSVPHLPVNVTDLGADAIAFSSHKMLGPMGVGVLWARRDILDQMRPYQAGSNMAHDVDLAGEHLSQGALKFGAGTPNVSGPVGLTAAMGFLRTAGFSAVRAHELAINQRMIERLSAIRGVRILGRTDSAIRISVFAFTAAGRTPAELVAGLDREGIAIRAGDLAALPLLRRLGTTVAARASGYLYTTLGEVDRFGDVLEQVLRNG